MNFFNPDNIDNYLTINLKGDNEVVTVLFMTEICSFNKVYSFPLTGPSKPKVQISAKPKTIEAQDRSPITLTIGDNVTALTNTSITIQCPTSGVPTPTVTWTKDGKEIPDGGRYIEAGDNSLLISNANLEDNARYTCTADSIAGQDSASSEVRIVGTCATMIHPWLSPF